MLYIMSTITLHFLHETHVKFTLYYYGDS